MTSEQNPEQVGGQKNPLVAREEEILTLWEKKDIFKKTLEKPAPQGEFVFYEGPPTANGKPGIHHLESRSFKDVIPRYKTMKGFHVGRKAGWDTHGLPVELEVEKKLGLKSKKEIESYGIEKFNQACKESVWMYVDEWKKFSERIAYWLDFEHPYVTYTSDYIESVWNIIKTIHERGLIYKDYKVVPWCPRCGTALSSHELAQGYKDVKDLSVYVKFKLVHEENTFVLAWTTTPWTLPGNVALAVGKDVEYIKVKKEGETLILAKERLSAFPDLKDGVSEEIKGSELVGKQYEPLYPYLQENLAQDQKEKLGNAFKIYDANFVTTADGTGVVHTAVMYGQDDFELGTRVGLPKHHLVGTDGNFLANVGPFSGRFVKDEDVAVDVIKDLAGRGLLFHKEKHEHSYPFCWRCSTPLIYYARDSWYIKMSSLREKLLEENEKVNWEPENIKAGRFGEWLREIKDWAISRERYWGTPLPFWISEDGTEMEVIGSIDDLKKKVKARNTFYTMRHGQAENNVQNVVSSLKDNPHHLTDIGRKQVEEASADLVSKKIDYIYASDFIRTTETAQLVAGKIGVPKENIIFDARLRELNLGDFNLHQIGEARAYFKSYEERFTKPAPNGESFSDVRKRMALCVDEINQKHEGKSILIISHEVPLWLLIAEGNGWSTQQAIEHRSDESDFVKNAAILELPFLSLPRNHEGEVDLHRPYIDNFVFESSSGKKMKRVPEVMDVWFDSGAMPFAQNHYPFENKEWVDTKGYPADYISEAIDQTRGWFYTLHAIGVLLGRGNAYKNVICLGHILDKDGLKMSKSKGNTVNPWEAIEKYGVDPLRYWMYTINQPGESKNFDIRTVDDVVKKVFNLVLNVLKFYEMYAKEGDVVTRDSNHPLDRWIIAKLDELIRSMTSSLDAYRPLDAGREIREFIAELSQWYVRRSRDRFKGEDEADKKSAQETLGYVLRELSKVMAPFTPFVAEDIYLRVTMGKEKESVHLEDWPEVREASEQDTLIVSQMKDVRGFVTLALEARAKAGIKIRQPLGLFSIKGEGTALPRDLIEIIMDEVNVKDIAFVSNLETDVLLDTTITPELKEEGDMRELVRAIQDHRKEKGLSPEDPLDLEIAFTAIGKVLYEKFEQEIKSVCNIRHISFANIEDGEVWFKL